MAQWEKAFSTKPEHLSVILENHMIEAENRLCTHCSLTSMHTLAPIHTHTQHTHTYTHTK